MPLPPVRAFSARRFSSGVARYSASAASVVQARPGQAWIANPDCCATEKLDSTVLSRRTSVSVILPAGRATV